MVISQIMGGLGNQMFQFAAGRALAAWHNTGHKLDIAAYGNTATHQGFELGKVFHANIDTATRCDLKAVLGWQASAILRRWLARRQLAPLRSPAFVVEPYFNYRDLRPVSGVNSYLSGYWQSEKYFSTLASDIRQQFRFKPMPSAENQAWLDVISRTNAVSLHVRRGDFVSSKKNLAYHGVCSPAYYSAAIRHVVERVAKPTFFVFSDDLAWAQSNIPIAADCHYVGHNTGTASFNDMRLMSRCQHHIIANSSFSWWGAWLNDNPQKTVVAPARWFAHTANTHDLLPLDWVVL
jgi:hypothetical protein